MTKTTHRTENRTEQSIVHSMVTLPANDELHTFSFHSKNRIRNCTVGSWTSSWPSHEFNLKIMKKKKSWINFVPYGRWKKTHFTFFVLVILVQVRYAPAIHMKIEVCFVERLRGISIHIETIVRDSYLCCGTIVLSTFQINWVVRKFVENLKPPLRQLETTKSKRNANRRTRFSESRDFWRARTFSLYWIIVY